MARKGLLLPPSSRAREPLSLVKMTRVLSSSPQGFEFAEDDGGCPVNTCDGRAIYAVFRFADKGFGGIVGQVNVHVGEVEEEGLVFVVAHETDAFFDVAFGDAALVGLCLDDFFVAQ